jgi:alcohol dehydrogenase class IV
MICCQYPLPEAGCEGAFTIDAARVTFGRGCLREAGDRARALGLRRVALFTDATIAKLPFVEVVLASLRQAGVDVVTYAQVHVEPTDRSFEDAARFAAEVRADGYLSLGGGSVIDTCKAANLLATHPAPLHAYVNAPVGEARPVPGALAPHIACPTTSGTGSEVTGIAIFDDTRLRAKTGIASAALRPTEALIDPEVSSSLPSDVVAASGLDVLCHAVESFTARPFTARAAPERASSRPMSQGRNPWSDIGCREALALTGRYLLRAARDAHDHEAREAMMWSATLAGMAFGNAGVHLPHAMAYAVAGLAHETDYRRAGYPAGEPLVPHGISVVVNAPAVARFSGAASPDRHLEAAARLGADVRGAAPEDAGEVLAARLITLMRDLDMPNGVGGIGYAERHLPALVDGASAQARLLANAPRQAPRAALADLFRAALSYW